MATIAEVKTKIESANALGIANLTEKGVEIGANATTYEIMKNIAEVTGGGGQYKSVTYNGDNTVALVDKQGVYHVIECEYTNNKLTGVTYDGKAIELTYEGNTLVSIGKTEVDMVNAPITPSGDATLNIAYGETAPEDTSKLWIKTEETDVIHVVDNLNTLTRTIETEFASLDIPIEVNASLTAIGDKVYIVGGYSNGFLANIRCFDITNGGIEIVGDLGDALNASLVASIGDNIYVFGGWSDSRVTLSDKIYCFNITTNTVRTIDATITARENGSAVAIGDKIYLLGGFGGSNYNMPIEIFDTITETVEKLNITTSYGQGSRAAAIGKDIYYICGTSGTHNSSIYKFDTEDNTFASIGAPLEYSGWATGVCSLGQYLYVIGGRKSNTNFKYLQIVDTKTNKVVTETILPVGLRSMGVVEVNDKVFVLGGTDSSDQQVSGIHCIKTSAPLETNSLYAIAASQANGIELNISNINININFVYKINSDNYVSVVNLFTYANDSWQQI